MLSRASGVAQPTFFLSLVSIGGGSGTAEREAHGPSRHSARSAAAGRWRIQGEGEKEAQPSDVRIRTKTDANPVSKRVPACVLYPALQGGRGFQLQSS